MRVREYPWWSVGQSLAWQLAAELRIAICGRNTPTNQAVHGVGSGPAVPINTPLQLITWNLQFCASRSRWFFYDGGTHVHADPQAVRATLAKVSAVIHNFNADFVLLQEVDCNSDRTQRVDQLDALVHAARLPYHTAAPYFQVRYLPHPPRQHLGRMDMRLLTLSRYPIAQAQSWPLPRLHEPWLRKLFNLKRVLLESVLPTQGGYHLSLGNTHLSAFSHGDGTLDRQVQVLLRHSERVTRAKQALVLAGDFNALPPSDPAARLGAHAALYPEAHSPITPLYNNLQSAISDEMHRTHPQAYRTYLPYEASEPDRAIDHVFASARVEILRAEVLHAYNDLSDHLPVRVWFRLRDAG